MTPVPSPLCNSHQFRAFVQRREISVDLFLVDRFDDCFFRLERQRIICVTDDDREYLRDYLPDNQLSVINTGVDTSYYHYEENGYEKNALVPKLALILHYIL